MLKKTSTAVALSPNDPSLSERQRQILSLLQTGKANKEIATVLGIGLGTVKQHAVALFRKLRVTNRTMAASRGIALGSSGTDAPQSAVGESQDNQIELRPSSVLSLAANWKDDNAEARPMLWRLLQQTVAHVVAERDCTLIARPDNAIEVIFGLNRVRENDVCQAVEIAVAIAETMRRDCVSRSLPTPILHAGLASGYLLASMHFRGGWTGESVAGPLIARARQTRDRAPPDTLLADPTSRRLMAFARRDEAAGNHSDGRIPLARTPAPGIASKSDPGASPRCYGRDQELARLMDRVGNTSQMSGAFVWVKGEAGMGKTTLGRAFAGKCRRAGVRVIELRCGEFSLVEQLDEVIKKTGLSGRTDPVARTASAIKTIVRRAPMVLVIDDLHLAGDIDAALIEVLAGLAAKAPLLLVGLGRSIRHSALKTLPFADSIRVGRLPPDQMKRLIKALGASTKAGSFSPTLRSAMVRLANGVPLFAVEIARAVLLGEIRVRQSPRLPITLVVQVMSRIDTLPVDRSLLAWLSTRAPVPTAALAGWNADPGIMRPALQSGVTAGVLLQSAKGTVEFAHPVVQAVIRQTCSIEKSIVAPESSMLPPAFVAEKAKTSPSTSPKRPKRPRQPRTVSAGQPGGSRARVHRNAK